MTFKGPITSEEQSEAGHAPASFFACMHLVSDSC